MPIVHRIDRASTAWEYQVSVRHECLVETRQCLVCQRPTQGDTLLRLTVDALRFLEHTAHQTPRPFPRRVQYAYAHKPIRGACVDDQSMARALFSESYVPIHRSCLYAYLCQYFLSTRNDATVTTLETLSILVRYYSLPYLNALRTLLAKTGQPLARWHTRGGMLFETEHVWPLAEYVSRVPWSARPRSPKQEMDLWLRQVVALRAHPSVHDDVTFLRFPPAMRAPVSMADMSPAQIARRLQQLWFPDVRVFDASGIALYL